ncbi:MAG: hypothetical protein J6W31_06055 [Clostridia bacterium]|nr:hypothetical protein [Clostridia bacterium]
MDTFHAFQLWSGGKDSTCSIVIENMYRLDLRFPPSSIVMAEVMFDNKRGISGELPEHMEWVHTVAKPFFESLGHRVEIRRSKKDYLDCFYRCIQSSKLHPENVGRYQGFPLGGSCLVQRECKLRTVKEIRQEYGAKSNVEILGIAADEHKRLARLGRNKVSLLQMFGVNEVDTYSILKPYNLINPIYRRARRGGCWFCPNQSYHQLSLLKKHRPDLWEELKELSHVPNTVARGFKWGESFADVEAKVDRILSLPEQEDMFRMEGGLSYDEVY